MPDATEKKKSAPLIPAATVLLLREGEGGVEVFMVVRHHQIDFASGALVFPGGKLDASDAADDLAAHCRGADGLTAVQRSLRVGAIREAFEESGVLLARPAGEAEFVSAARVRALQPWRARLEGHEASMLEFARAEKLDLALDALVPFAHWITPSFMPKRFDTHFFVAAAPADHDALHDGSESVDSVWIAPRDALADGRAKKRVIIFPTRLNLEKLARSANLGAALDAQPVVTVQPWLEQQDGKTLLRIPPDAGYGDVFEEMPPRIPK